ncbi:TetR/AcrR family transcriptional regulator [Streptomyces sp. NPDC020412]|uniref:TetR/AcrR family transcriptional regulator n=1 Tax=Streptomyces sp. NPDC020412 TaxID=3365073 RepID=UPI0037A5F9A0
MADVERSTALLWGTGTRRGLSLERIVRCAVELADTEGLPAVSMRRLAERLGFTTMALYRHVPGKADLLALMRDAVMAELTPAEARTEARTEAPTEAPTEISTEISTEVASATTGGESRGWRADLEAWARASIELQQRHPWLADLGEERQIPGPHGVASFERALSVAARTGLPPAQVIAVVTLVGDFVDGAARKLALAARTEQRTGVSDEEWWGARSSLYDQLDERYPTLTRLYEEGGYDAPLDPFEFGLRRVLDGVEALVAEAGRQPERNESRNVTRCATCGEPVEDSATGRPRTYCSPACRQRAHRRRSAAAS